SIQSFGGILAAILRQLREYLVDLLLSPGLGQRHFLGEDCSNGFLEVVLRPLLDRLVRSAVLEQRSPICRYVPFKAISFNLADDAVQEFSGNFVLVIKAKH